MLHLITLTVYPNEQIILRLLIQILTITLLLAPGAPLSAESASKYTCVMHPEVIQDTPGKCPKCGMTLVLKKQKHEHAQDHDGMQMHSSIDIADPMARESSGTAWVPDSTPMYGKMFMFGDDMLMLHGGAFPRYTNVSTQRGDDRIDMPNWFMAMFSHLVRRKRAARFSRHDESRSADGRRPRLSASFSKRRIVARSAAARSPASARSVRRAFRQLLAKVRARFVGLSLLRLSGRTGARSADVHASAQRDG